MIKVGSRRYKDQFPESKVVLVNAFGERILWEYTGSMFKDVDSMDREFVGTYLDKVSLRCIMLICDDSRTDKLFVGTHRAFFINVLTNRLSKYGIVNLPVFGLVMNPQTHRTNSMKLLRLKDMRLIQCMIKNTKFRCGLCSRGPITH